MTSRTSDLVLKHDLSPKDPPANWLWKTIATAMAEPAVGDPRRPALLQLRSEADANLVRSHLKRLGIDCVVCEDLDCLDSAFAGLVERLRGKRISPLVEMPGMVPGQIAGYYEAAACFYRQAPWRAVGDVPIKIECDRFKSGPWYACVLGPGRNTLGLTLYEDLDLLRRIGNGELSLEESARISSTISVIFDQKHDLAPADLEAIEKHGWTVAGPEAYPLAIRLNPGRAVRSLLAWELELLEACLRAIPTFAEAKPPETMTVKLTAAGHELTLTMQWCPLRRGATEATAPNQPRQSPTPETPSTGRLGLFLRWEAVGALCGIIIGAVFNTSGAAIFVSQIIVPILATVGALLGGIYGHFFNKARHCHGGLLLWVILLGLVGIVFGMLTTALVVASLGSLAGFFVWWFLRPFFKADFFLSSCAALGVAVQTWLWDASGAFSGAVYGGLIGLAGGMLLILLCMLLVRLLIRDATGGRRTATLAMMPDFLPFVPTHGS